MSACETKARWDALTAVWPQWRLYQDIMSLRGMPRPPLEVMEWLRDFRAALLQGTEAFERHIAGGGLSIETDLDCDCDTEVFEGSPDQDPLAWLHANHEAYNEVQIQLIESSIGLPAFREILERDLLVEDSDLGPKWGNLLRKDYTKSILDLLGS